MKLGRLLLIPIVTLALIMTLMPARVSAAANPQAQNPPAQNQTSPCPNGSFFFFPPWYKYLQCEQDPGGSGVHPTFSFPSDILPVGAALIDILIRLGGLVAIFSVIAGGAIYMTAGGDFARTAAAKRRVYNSAIGLGIISIAAPTVSFISNKLWP